MLLFVQNVMPKLVFRIHSVKPRNCERGNNCLKFTLTLLLGNVLLEVGNLDEALSVWNNSIESFSNVAIRF